jgi:radical SAM-linked protein
MSAFRLRVRYRKSGRLRFLSHLETTRACERTARRAGLPYAVSQGFNPRMRVAFGPALPVGTAGLREYYDLTLSEYVPADDVVARLQAATVQELAPSRAGYVAGDDPSLSAALTIATYEAAVGTDVDPHALSEAMEAVTRSGEFVVERKGRTKVFDLTETLPKEPDVSSQTGETLVRMATRMGPAGSLRPEQLVGAALETIGVADAPIRVVRTDLFAEEGSDWLRPLD